MKSKKDYIKEKIIFEFYGYILLLYSFAVGAFFFYGILNIIINLVKPTEAILSLNVSIVLLIVSLVMFLLIFPCRKLEKYIDSNYNNKCYEIDSNMKISCNNMIEILSNNKNYIKTKKIDNITEIVIKSNFLYVKTMRHVFFLKIASFNEDDFKLYIKLIKKRALSILKNQLNHMDVNTTAIVFVFVENWNFEIEEYLKKSVKNDLDNHFSLYFIYNNHIYIKPPSLKELSVLGYYSQNNEAKKILKIYKKAIKYDNF